MERMSIAQPPEPMGKDLTFEFHRSSDESSLRHRTDLDLGRVERVEPRGDVHRLVDHNLVEEHDS